MVERVTVNHQVGGSSPSSGASMSDKKNIKLVIIEDDKDIRELLSYNISSLGYQVHSFSNGESGLKYLRNNKSNLVLLDLMLPGFIGFDIC